MKIIQSNSIAAFLENLFALIDADSQHYAPGAVEYYFRGEKHNFEDSQSPFPSEKPPIPRLFLPKNEKLLKHEKDIFYEAIQCFPAEFANDRLTIDKLARMQHYDYMTRLLDVTQKIPTALAMTLPSQSADEPTMGEYGFVHIYRVKREKIKYSDSDTVIIISNLVKLDSEKIQIRNDSSADLGYLTYECQVEKPGAYFDSTDDIGQRLIRDIQKVWCVRPVMNNPRLNFQRGEFFLFGCGDLKSRLKVTFSEQDFENPKSSTCGIARIGAAVVSPKIKSELRKRQIYLDIGLDRMYPDFHFHAHTLEQKYNK